MINLQGNHTKRKYKVDLSSAIFHPKNTPADYFSHQLFDRWDDDGWDRFYNSV